MHPLARLSRLATARSHLPLYAAFCVGMMAAILPAVAFAQAAGPRTGPIAVVYVTLSGNQSVNDLVAGGYDIGNVRGSVVTIYATPEELRQLREAGYSYVDITPSRPAAKAWDGYHTYATLTAELQNEATAHPDICRVVGLGESVRRRTIWAVLITNHPDVEEDEPEFKYLGGIHGDEPVGPELCLRFIDHLLTGYGADVRVTGLIDTSAIWVVPLINPDGFESAQRYNADGFDLNRSFPAYPSDFTGTVFDGAPLDAEGRPQEVAAIMQWTVQHTFVLSASFHTGSLVVNYPYDDDGKPSGVDVPSPDDALFQDIAKRYSIHNTLMWTSSFFPDGITNGGAWYTISGGMQDWNYRYAGCNEVTIELSNT